MSKITTTVESLKAVAPFMSTEEVRYYLKGVLFTKKLLVATDGHKLAVIYPALYEGEASDFIMPDNVVKQIIRHKPKRGNTQSHVIIDTDALTVEITGSKEDAIYKYVPVDGTFPDWRRVIPDASNYDRPSPAAFNTKYLATFEAFGDCVVIWQNNDPKAPSLFRATTAQFEALGVLMPMRRDITMPLQPEWLNL